MKYIYLYVNIAVSYCFKSARKTSRRIENRPQKTINLHPRVLLKCRVLQCFVWCGWPKMYVFTMWIAFVYCILQWNLLEQGPWNGAPRTIFWRFAVFSCIGTATLYKLAMWDNFIPVAFIYRHMACLTSFRSPLPRSDVCPQAGIYLSFFLWSGMACFKRRHVPPIVPVSTCMVAADGLDKFILPMWATCMQQLMLLA